MQNHILSIILFTPLIGAFVLLFVPKENKDAIRWTANIFSLGGFLTLGPGCLTGPGDGADSCTSACMNREALGGCAGT